MVQRKGLKSREFRERSKEIWAKSYVLKDCEEVGISVSIVLLAWPFFRLTGPVAFITGQKDSSIPYILPKWRKIGLALVRGSSGFPGLRGILKAGEKLRPGLCSLA